MTPNELHAAMRQLKIPTREMATWLHCTPRAVRYYLDGARPIPEALALLLALVLRDADRLLPAVRLVVASRAALGAIPAEIAA